MFLLSVALQGASLVAVREIDTSVIRSRQEIAVASDQRAVVEQFVNATYLAVVGLATSDWELLLAEQAVVQRLAERFAAVNAAMLDGGGARIDDLEVTLAGTRDPEVRARLTAVQQLWTAVHAAHARVLRSENWSLKHNPHLEQFRALSGQLIEALGELSTLLQRRALAQRVWLGGVQRAVPVGAFLLTLASFAFVLVRLLLPFAASTEELSRSEAALREARDALEQRVAERTQELAEANEALRHAHDDLELRVKERTEELREAQRRAVALARQAGMAELASNMLHNVGNVLNSLKTSSTLLGERLQAFRVESLVKLAGLLKEHEADLAAFFTRDDRGRRLPPYLEKLGHHLSAERTEMQGMAADLQRHVEHIRAIVEVQQTYALSSSLVEATSLEELIEDALRISAAALGRHGIRIEREVAPLPRLLIDKHKLLQILLNLISNAKYALDSKPPGERRLCVRIDRPTQEQVRVQVIDNGMGMAAELLPKIFQHGFTTRKEGHGFGLHSCAIAARALGGSLSAHSEGPGLGATFTLDLPCQPAVSERIGAT
jgi:signal transduction histidine kinase